MGFYTRSVNIFHDIFLYVSYVITYCEMNDVFTLVTCKFSSLLLSCEIDFSFVFDLQYVCEHCAHTIDQSSIIYVVSESRDSIILNTSKCTLFEKSIKIKSNQANPISCVFFTSYQYANDPSLRLFHQTYSAHKNT